MLQERKLEGRGRESRVGVDGGGRAGAPTKREPGEQKLPLPEPHLGVLEGAPRGAEAPDKGETQRGDPGLTRGLGKKLGGELD
eukprot:9701213-Prorocentrum_lima.AAC.1